MTRLVNRKTALIAVAGVGAVSAVLLAVAPLGQDDGCMEEVTDNGRDTGTGRRGGDKL